MTPLICEQAAPPEVFDILHELSLGDDATIFTKRILHAAEHEEGLSTFAADGTTHSKTLLLMFMLIARALGQTTRTGILQDGTFVADFMANTGDMISQDGLALAIYFASDWLLDKMIANIPAHVRSVLIAQMPNELHTTARSMFTT